MLPNEDTLKTFVYNQFDTPVFKKYNSYICGHPKKYYYQYGGTTTTWKAENTIICIFHDGVLGISSSGSISNSTHGEGYYFDKDIVGYRKFYSKNTGDFTLDTNNILYSNSCDKYNYYGSFSCKDLLLDTDYYQKKRDEELKTILQENSPSGSDTSASVDITTTNNLLWAIGLILCVTLLLSFLRKIFNRGVK